MPLKEKKAVVIGGSPGIGLAIAKALVNSGAHAVIASRSSNKLDEAQRTIGVNAAAYRLDVTQEERVQQFFEDIGPFDHLVCTAVSGINAPFLEMDIADARTIFKTKLWGQYYAAKYGAPMKGF